MIQSQCKNATLSFIKVHFVYVYSEDSGNSFQLQVPGMVIIRKFFETEHAVRKPSKLSVPSGTIDNFSEFTQLFFYFLILLLFSSSFFLFIQRTQLII